MTDAAVSAATTSVPAVSARGAFTERFIRYAVWGTVAYLVLSPVAMLVYGAFRTASPTAAGEFTLENFATIFSGSYVQAFQNTMVFGVATSITCASLGAFLAWLVFRTDMPGRGILTILLTTSFYFPSFLTAEAWVLLLAPKSGMLNNIARLAFPEFEGLNVHSMGGIVWVSTLAYLPYTFLFLAAPLQSIDPSYEEAASVAGAPRWRVITTITLPLVSYAILSGALLTFILAVGLFGVPAILGMPAQIYVLATKIFQLLQFYPSNYQVAAALSVLLMTVTIAAIFLQRYIVGRHSHTSITGKGYRPRQMPLGAWRWPAFGLCMGYFACAVLLPTLALLYVSLTRFYTGLLDFDHLTLEHYRKVLFEYPITARAFVNSFILSAGGATIAIFLCAMISYIVIKGRSRGRSMLELLTMMPAAIPGLVIAVGLLWAYIRSPIYGTIFILLVSYVTHYLPQGFRVVSSNLIQIDSALEESARVAGASWMRTLRDIVLPLIRPALVSGWMLLFVAFFRELSSAVLLYSHGNEVLSVAIWDLHQNGNLGMLSALAMMMLAVVYLLFFIMNRLGVGVTRAKEG